MIVFSGRAGASSVICVDLLPERLERATKMGADFVINSLEV